jgi:PilZ domain-containing protein
MANNAETYVKLYVNVEDQASITCPRCNAIKVANVKKYKGSRKPLTVQCRCGWIFHAILETRKYYRKAVKLRGSYAWAGSYSYGPMVIENLSMSGIGCRTRVHHPIHVGDVLQVRFMLDNQARSEIAKDIVVRIVIKQVTDAFFGAEFCDITAHYKELAWYLHPS